MTSTLRMIKAVVPCAHAKAVIRLAVAAALTFGLNAAAIAQTTSPLLDNQLLAKAAPDECFAGIGAPYPAPVKGSCPKGSVPKTNEAYVWGLTQVGTKLWFGTAPNVLCLVLGGFLGATDPVQTASWVCEFGQSQYAQSGIPAAIGDWRPPRAYVYTPGAKQRLVNVTPTDPVFASTLGLRSAGSIGDVVFLAGPSLAGTAVNFFAFKSSTQAYLGSCQASAFSNIRQWVVTHGVLYAGVGAAAGGGGVIRWNGSESAPFQQNTTCGFELVGAFAGDAAYVTAYGANSDRLAVSAWPNPAGAGVYISPAMDVTTGLHAANAGSWTRIWKPSDYEPDPVTAATYGGGAIAYWQDALYFGTMHVPGTSALAHIQAYGEPADQAAYLEVLVNTYRAASIWRINDAETATPSAELLYGESTLPAYNAVTGEFDATTTNFTPQYGSSGFGNIFNNYTWTAAIFKGRLFFGTMDWSFLAGDAGIPLLPPELAELLPKDQVLESYYGADLWRFDSVGPAVAEDVSGVENYLNYGIRSMIASPDALFIGTANPMNLEREGGWELRSMPLQSNRKK